MTTGSLDAPPRQAPSRVTIRDVAKAAGVSPSTVSRVMNGSPQIPQATRERILDLAQRLSYRPNAFARTLRGQRSGIIGVLTDDNEGVFANAMLRGLERVVADQGYSLFLGNTLGEAERERRHIRALMDRQVDGLILLDSVVARRSAPSGDIGQTPLVFLYCYTSALPVPCVIPDDRGGALLAVGHLISLGRRRIAYISGPRSGPLAWEASLLRQEGYLAALRQAGLVADPSLIEEGDWTEGSGFRAAQRLFALDQPPDAIFCSNDYVAMGALEAARAAGLRVPADVALVGFDDRKIAGDASIPLTTVRLPHEEMGRIAIGALLDAIGGEAQQAQTVAVPCELLVRASTAG